MVSKMDGLFKLIEDNETVSQAPIHFRIIAWNIKKIQTQSTEDYYTMQITRAEFQKGPGTKSWPELGSSQKRQSWPKHFDTVSFSEDG